MPFSSVFSDDRLLDGRVLLRQSRSGFRSGSDAVLLAAASHPPPGGQVLELGAGTGAAMLALAWRRPDCRVVGVEIQPGSVDMARYNIARNVMSDRAAIVQADISQLPVQAGQYDLVMANPPYFQAGRHRVSPVRARALARTDHATPLEIWARAALAAVTPGGQVVFINRRERLSEMIALFSGVGEIRFRTLPPATAKPAKRILVQVRMGGSGVLELPPLHLHVAGGAPSALATAVLRNGAPVFW